MIPLLRAATPLKREKVSLLLSFGVWAPAGCCCHYYHYCHHCHRIIWWLVPEKLEKIKNKKVISPHTLWNLVDPYIASQARTRVRLLISLHTYHTLAHFQLSQVQAAAYGRENKMVNSSTVQCYFELRCSLICLLVYISFVGSSNIWTMLSVYVLYLHSVRDRKHVLMPSYLETEVLMSFAWHNFFNPTNFDLMKCC